jgi:hypothetical protein
MASDGITGREKDMMGFLGQFRDQQPPTKRKGKDFTDYQEEPGRFHRFISQDDPTFEEYAHNDIVGYICKTPDKFQGLRRDGVLKGTRRVQFTLPGRDDEPKTLELMYSRSKDNPSFGAVRVKLPLNVQVSSEKQRVMVTRVNPGSAAENARIQQGDIIRAISVPESTVEGSGTVSWWDKMMSSPMPKTEEGTVILNSKDAVPEFNAALQANLRENGRAAEVVLVLERPFRISNFDDGSAPRQGGYPMRNAPRLQEQLVPIPIPVDDNDGLPRMPPPPPKDPDQWYP